MINQLLKFRVAFLSGIHHLLDLAYKHFVLHYCVIVRFQETINHRLCEVCVHLASHLAKEEIEHQGDLERLLIT